MRVALLFIDGVGVGARDAAVNPLARLDLLLSQFEDGTGATLPYGGRRLDLDTTFGVEGRPQSATNQTAIFTGRPAPKLLGKHVLGFPTAPLRALIAEASIIRQLADAGRTATFANAYPAAWLDVLGVPRRASSTPDLHVPERYRKKGKASASTLAMAAGKVELRTFDDARRGQGLTHDIDGTLARARGLDVPTRTPREAAEIFWGLARDFTLFEHYLADEAGHEQDFPRALRALETFDAFAREVIAARPADAQVLIVSDHGNVEDLSTRSHTRNPVALLSFGPAQVEAHTVADVGRLILELSGRDQGSPAPVSHRL
ncbi:MAG: metalloenzyme [Myxococcota bacterium]